MLKKTVTKADVLFSVFPMKRNHLAKQVRGFKQGHSQIQLLFFYFGTTFHPKLALKTLTCDALFWK